jgi:hypothetical protein
LVVSGSSTIVAVNLHPGFFLGTAAILLANIAHPLVLGHLARRKARRLAPPPAEPETPTGV